MCASIAAIHLLHFELVSILEILLSDFTIFFSRYYAGGTGSSVCDRMILFCGKCESERKLTKIGTPF